MDAKKLKWIAMITMLLDHFGAGVIRLLVSSQSLYQTLYGDLRFVGRTAFPIFLFLMVEGVLHTRSHLKYMRDLLICAVLSEAFFDRALFGKWFDIQHQNVFFTLFLCVLLGFAVKKICETFHAGDALRYDLIILSAALAAWTAYLIKCDYRYGGVLAFFAMLLVRLLFRNPKYFRQVNVLAVMAGYLVLFLYNKNEVGAFPALLFVLMYDGSRGKVKHKYFYYSFYALHLLVIAMIRIHYGG